MAHPIPAQPVNDDSGEQIHRIRRSEVLLGELYGLKKPPKPQFRARKVRGVRTMLAVSLLTIAAALSVVYYKINIFIMLQEDAHTKEANLEAAVQRKANLFSNLVKLTLSHAELEHTVFSHVAEMRTEIVKQSKLPDALADAVTKETAKPPGTPGRADLDQILKMVGGEGGADASIGRLLAMVEQYPNLRSSETYQHAMTALIEMEDRIAERRMELNESIRMYDTAVTSIPWQYLASVSGFKWRDYSHAGDGTSAAMNIDSGLYQQLLPMVRTQGVPK
ncbi:MAG: LemA family protein [Rhodospirillaceae bacterium]